MKAMASTLEMVQLDSKGNHNVLDICSHAFFCERLAVNGISTNLVNYFTDKLHEETVVASTSITTAALSERSPDCSLPGSSVRSTKRFLFHLAYFAKFPHYFLLGAAEVFTFMGQHEFHCEHAQPRAGKLGP
ncbi:hypothetical protein FF1_010935 [Malus domestica]